EQLPSPARPPNHVHHDLVRLLRAAQGPAQAGRDPLPGGRHRGPPRRSRRRRLGQRREPDRPHAAVLRRLGPHQPLGPPGRPQAGGAPL
ncbi:MAG: Mycoredoxin, partial [uncultured Friedmanniella sp.]